MLFMQVGIGRCFSSKTLDTNDGRIMDIGCDFIEFLYPESGISQIGVFSKHNFRICILLIKMLYMFVVANCAVFSSSHIFIQPTGFERKADEIWGFSVITEIQIRVIQGHLPPVSPMGMTVRPFTI